MTDQGSSASARGAAVWLRAFEREDLAAYQAAVNDADVAFWAGYSAPLSVDTALDWYEKRVRAQHGREAYYYTICPLGSREFLGTIWLWNFGTRLGGAELSIYVADKARWGSGVGTDAVNALTDLAFGFLDLDRIWLVTSAENPRAIRAFEKAGFVTEGRLRQHQRRRGRLLDTMLMAMLRRDWEALSRPRSWDYAAGSAKP